jgi:hypothetical protein
MGRDRLGEAGGCCVVMAATQSTFPRHVPRGSSYTRAWRGYHSLLQSQPHHISVLPLEHGHVTELCLLFLGSAWIMSIQTTTTGLQDLGRVHVVPSETTQNNAKLDSSLIIVMILKCLAGWSPRNAGRSMA